MTTSSDRLIGPTEPAPRGLTPTRALAVAIGSALVGAAATVILGGALALSAGLLVVAAVAGRVIGQAMAGLQGGWPQPRRVLAAIAIATVGFIAGQLGLWWYAGIEGGVLPLADYLGQAFGVLVPLQLVIEVGVAWWSAR